MIFQDKHIVLGVTGSIAAYKAVELASRLTQAGARVSVIMTAAAQQFVSPLTFRSITHQPVVTDWFDPDSDLSIQHVSLAEQADVVLIAPATADCIAKVALGLSGDPLTGTALATRAPLVVAPAMDANMYDHPATQGHVATLRERGVTLVGPDAGRLASGLTGMGRLSSPEAILGALAQTLGRDGDFKGRTVVVSAGGTKEPIDPVRIITNRSSGKMGYALAEAARNRGAEVVLVSAASLLAPYGVKAISVETVMQMREAVLGACREADVLIMAAAVSDFRPAHPHDQKLKKDPKADSLTLELEKNPDFFNEVPLDVLRVGFAAETEDLLANAREKLRSKGLAFIVANDVSRPDSGFEVDTNKVTILDEQGGEDDLPLLSKDEVADRILDKVAHLLSAKDRPAD